MDFRSCYSGHEAVFDAPLSAQGPFPEVYEDAVDSYTRALEKQSQDADTLSKRAAAYM
eukprot:jgi/Phyca11/503029/fgenesh2_kg.PHYCAscaffold_2_\